MDAKYDFTITGENPMDDKQTALENLDILMGLIGKATQMPPQINQDLLIKTLVNKLDAPEGIYIEPEERPEEMTPGQQPGAQAPASCNARMLILCAASGENLKRMGRKTLSYAEPIWKSCNKTYHFTHLAIDFCRKSPIPRFHTIPKFW